MSVNLQKGQKISLVKPGEPGLKRIMVGLGWDEVEQKRGWFAPKPQDIDCDASVILCGADGRIISNDIKTCCVYFGNLVHSSGAIVHQGDNLTGAGDGDDEQIMVDLPNIPANIDKLVFVVNIYDANVRHQHFGMIRNAFIRLVEDGDYLYLFQSSQYGTMVKKSTVQGNGEADGLKRFLTEKTSLKWVAPPSVLSFNLKHIRSMGKAAGGPVGPRLRR